MDVRGRARALRTTERLSAREIGERLGVPARTVARWLEGLPVPEWTRRPNAKDELRERAVALRADGWSVPDIARELGVSRSTAWLWVKERPLDHTGERARAGKERRRQAHAAWALQRSAARQAAQNDLMRTMAGAVGPIGPAELLRLGALIYWCEGSKSKPWRTSTPFQFCNSDPDLLRLFLRFLDVLAVPADDRVLRLAIHETADAETAMRWWSERLEVGLEHFRPPTIKTHKPGTNRLNRSEFYHGCLSIHVRRGARLYWLVAGLVQGVMAQVDSGDRLPGT